MASTTTRLITFAEFEKLPDHPRGLHYELRHGEVVELTPPVHEHYLVQRRLERLLEQAAGRAGEVCMEIGYRPLPEYQYWVADVAFVVRERWDRIPRTGHLQGSPELVIEVLSPSNTVSEILEKRRICLENGSQEFWVANIDRREIEVSTPDGRSIEYTAGQAIPLFFAQGALLVVADVFD